MHCTPSDALSLSFPVTLKILLLSDTHSYLDEGILAHVADADEVWHAGDVGDASVLDTLESLKPVRGVFGNIDDAAMRKRLPLNAEWVCEGVQVFMTHIGGYPGRYTARVRKHLDTVEPKPDLYICGHSHILRVMPDRKRGLLHMNPGACGRHGFHKIRTMLRFVVEEGRILRPEAIELGLRGR